MDSLAGKRVKRGDGSAVMKIKEGFCEYGLLIKLTSQHVMHKNRRGKTSLIQSIIKSIPVFLKLIHYKNFVLSSLLVSTPYQQEALKLQFENYVEQMFYLYN